MCALSSAVTVSRVLLGLDRSGATGTLRVRAEGRRAFVSLESGRVVGASVDKRAVTSQRDVVDGLVQMCRWDRMVLRLARAPGTSTCRSLPAPIPARSLALELMRIASKSGDAASMRAELGREIYQLSSAAQRFAQRKPR